MKKNYQHPAMFVLILATTAMVCASGISSVSGADGLNLSDEDTDDAGITSGNSRRGSFWDDEE